MFLLRLGVIVATAVVIMALSVYRYNREVRTTAPGQLVYYPSTFGVRVLGIIEAGSILRTPTELFFDLSKEGGRVRVRYIGEKTDDLRDLKTIVVVGNWDKTENELIGTQIALDPHYGFVAAAYAIAFGALAVFLFTMEREKAALYLQIKQEQIYQPEI